MIWRTFLQDPSTLVDSYVVVEVPAVTQDQSIMLKVADCEGNVRLWFGWGSKSALQQSRKKLTRLRKALDQVESGLNKLEGVR